MLWLTGHWEWHALCCYVVVPLEGEPTLVYSMGGTHAEAVRRETSRRRSPTCAAAAAGSTPR